jgi:hypothetical protein
MRAQLIMAVGTALVLSGCGETVSWGYRNKLDHAVAVVEHGWGGARRIALARHQTIPPGFGQLPNAIDLVAPDGHVFAHYRRSEIPRIGPEHILDYLVITPKSVYVESERQPSNRSEDSTH